MITGLYNFARSINHKRKELIWQQNGKRLSSVRRIERVHPIAGKRVVAMTFDDGPCAKDFMGSGKGLTASILDTLAEYGARATFDIIGTTEGNYPDEVGEKAHRRSEELSSTTIPALERTCWRELKISRRLSGG